MTNRIAVSRPLKIANALTGFVWWLGCGASVLLTVGLLASLWGAPFQIGSSLTVDIKARTGDPWALTSAAPVELDDVRGQLRLRDAGRNLQSVIDACNIAGLLVACYGVYLFRGLLKDVIAQEIFTERNTSRLSKLGWLSIAAAFVSPQLDRWLTWAMLDQVRSDAFLFSRASTPSSGYLFMMGILTLVLAEIWRYGLELQRDRDATV